MSPGSFSESKGVGTKIGGLKGPQSRSLKGRQRRGSTSQGVTLAVGVRSSVDSVASTSEGFREDRHVGWFVPIF